MAKTIFVTGDLVWDTHIARLPWAAKSYFQPHVQTQLKNRYGGAWYLRDAIKGALKAGSVVARVTAPKQATHVEIKKSRGPGGIAKAFSVWEWFPEDKSGTWRIKEFLGCQGAQWDNGKTPCQKLGDEPETADVLVIDDLGLGFVSAEKAWPRCLERPKTGPRSIIAKVSPPFDSPLWQKLFAPEWAGRLSVVIAAASLRDAGARLGRGYSWDQTIEEVQRIFSPGGVGSAMRCCKRVIVTFGRSGGAVFSRLARSPQETDPAPRLQFERFVYDPNHLEGTWSAAIDGSTFGTASMMTAALVCHEVLDLKPSTHVTVSKGLATARELHRVGAGSKAEDFEPGGNEEKCFIATTNAMPHHMFHSAYDRTLLDDPVLMKPADMPPPSLLTDALGVSTQFLTVAAEDIVSFGRKRMLQSVPRLECAKYFTVDREEIECLNTVRNLIQDYRNNPSDTRPLSLAVFGQPGSGKSFAIKQLSESIFRKARAVLEFNLSQFPTLEALHEAFHDVRDKSVQGQLPLVFWDEFDSAFDQPQLGWLKEFLAPMQDAKFYANGREHPFGKCIFIFAGGTCSSFAEFDRSAKDDKAFKNAKGPDFVSRLRGFVNIKGPNPNSPKGDEVHVVRRALLLRSLIERHHDEIIQRDSQELVIHPQVLAAFLRVEKYCHGARSMESIVSLSRLHGCRHFGPSELPPPEVVQLHVTPDFMEIALEQERVCFDPDHLNKLAAIIHAKWVAQKQQSGWTKGNKPGRDNVAKTDSRLVPYCDLDPADKEENLNPARLTLLRLEALGYEVRPKGSRGGKPAISPKSYKTLLEKIERSEHRRWMRKKMLAGWSFARRTKDDLLLHSDLRKFDRLPNLEKRLDKAISQAIQPFLDGQNLVLVKKPVNAAG